MRQIAIGREIGQMRHACVIGRQIWRTDMSISGVVATYLIGADRERNKTRRRRGDPEPSEDLQLRVKATAASGNPAAIQDKASTDTPDRATA
jgi:hypothetical protein